MLTNHSFFFVQLDELRQIYEELPEFLEEVTVTQFIYESDQKDD